MKLPKNNYKSRILLPTLLSATALLVSCSGAELPNFTDLIQQDDTVANGLEVTNTPQAIALTNSNNNNVNLQARAEDSKLTIEDHGSVFQITMNYSDDVSDATVHTQIFLNTDNDTSTGYAFNQQAWGEVGADYMIQNQYLYKSLTNATAWSWTPVAEVSDYLRTNKAISMTIEKYLIGSPCGRIQPGTLGRGETWDIETMYPVATQLIDVPLEHCLLDKTAPVVKLNGATDLAYHQGDTFVDEGATANDDQDGDLTLLITVSGSVDTAAPGVHQLTYTAVDSAGNVGSMIRTIRVLEEGYSLPSLDVSEYWGAGQTGTSELGLINYQEIAGSDDSQLTALEMDIAQDKNGGNLYLRYEWASASDVHNTRIYLDTDNNPTTGFKVSATGNTGPETGAEYMIENGVLAKYTGSNYEWSWSGKQTELPYSFHNWGGEYAESDVLSKVIIPASIVNGSRVGIMAMWMNADWTSHNVLHENHEYTLFSTGDDSVTVAVR